LKKQLLAFDRTGGHPSDKVSLKEQEEDENWQASEHTHRHHLIPFIGMLAHK
jgi:hypothetical protein